MRIDRLSRRQMLASVAASTVAACQTNAQQTSRVSRIKIGQIGTKHAHAAGKLSAIRSLSDQYEFVGIVEPDVARRQQLSDSEPFENLRWLTQDELLSTTDLSVIAVETPVRDLVPTALACVRAGKHVHLDKPAGPSMSDYRRLRRAASEAGVTIQMGYMLRYNPAFQFLFQVVRDGWLGEITEVTAAMGKLANETLRAELSEFAGGGMFELACHVIDAMVTVLGKPDRVTAHNRRSDGDRDSLADNQLAVFDYENAVATIRCNHLDPFGFPRRHFHVAGTLGAVHINPLEPPQLRLALDRPRGQFVKGFQDVALPASSGRYDDEFRDLAQVIRGEKALAWGAEHDLNVHEAVLLGSGMPLD